jgi:transglutaminase-like putative cysteine protease
VSTTSAATAFRPEVLIRMLAVLGLVVAPQLPRLPPWLVVVSLAFAAWCYFITRRSLKLPSLWLRILLSILLLMAVYAHYGTLLGRDVGAALLIAMLALKLMEIREARDIYVTVFLGYFLIIIGFLFSQSLWMAGYMLVVVTLLTSVLIDLNRTRLTAIGSNLRLAASLLLRALPLALVVFILFPRISGPLWGMPKDAYNGMIGLDEEMAPGLISDLIQSDAVAFRAGFDGPIPPPRQRYWRGPILWQTDGMAWRTGHPWSPVLRSDPPPLVASGDAVTYTVTLEPHNRRWLYALDLVGTAPPDTKIAPDFLLLRAAPLRERLRYTVTSYPDGVASRLSGLERQRALQLPARGDPQARALAQEWHRRYHDPATIVQQALQMFHNQPFIYTLHPPAIVGDFVDRFLFTTRKGFCEHYAASFTFLMRAAGIPARVVTGYQGGELNPIGNYLIVRQRDAHAWSEVWLDGHGWTRVDPTAAVAPERIDLSIDNRQQDIGDAVRFELPQAAWLAALWRETHFAWDALNNKWNQWVLSYGVERQADLLGWLSLGGLSWQNMAILLLAVVGAMLVGMVIFMLKRERQAEDAIVRTYQAFCRKLARRGLSRRSYEGPVDFARRVAAQRPDLAGQVHGIIKLYTALRYGAYQTPAALDMLRRAVRHFRP